MPDFSYGEREREREREGERERERARGKGTLVTRKGNFGNVSGNFCNDDRELW